MKNFFWLLRPYLKHGKIYIAVSLIFSCIILPLDSLLQVYFPQIILQLLSDKANFMYIVLAAAGFELVLLLITVCDDLYNNVFHELVSNKISPKINLEIYEKSTKTKYSYIDDPDYYDNFSWTIKDYAGRSSEAVQFLFSFLTAIITISSMTAVLVSSSVWLIVIIIVGFVLKSIVVAKVNKLDIEKDEETVPTDRRLDYCHRIFYINSYATELRTTKLKEIILKHYNTAVDSKIGLIKKYIKKTFYLLVLNDFFVRLSEFLIVVGIARSIYTGRIVDVGAYITLFMASEKLNQIFYSLFDLFRTWNRLSAYGGKIREFFKYEDEKSAGEGTSCNNEPYAVAFQNVSFHYPNAGFGLKDLNFSIDPGEKVAIVGENGAGKTTIVKLLLGLYDVSAGQILFNDKPMNKYNLNVLRNTIGVAFQDTNIYALTLDENLQLYGENDEEATDLIEEKFGIKKILEKNNATSSDVMTREFDEKGIMVSGGEAQRIAVARLAMKKFKLIILDEPSSALDPIAEYELNKLLVDSIKDTTTIMIAHRLSSVRNMDKILVMENGALKEMGTHDELMRLGGLYYEMFTKQAENYKL